jgi:Tol biopolymer transport system component
MVLQSGARLGPYEIVDAVGRGGFGEVYRARDTRLDRSVAIKVLPSADPDLKARFEREARTIASLQHPNICALHDVGRHEGIDFLVLEFLEGETLSARIARGPLPLAEALDIAMAIASALDRAHRAGIVHRDVKPDNVMLTRSGPKLLDFGVAKLRLSAVATNISTAATTDGAPVTRVGTIVGTLHYMSPEQVSGADSDARSDIWALGCVLYEMLTGERAFQGGTATSLIAAIMHGGSRKVAATRPLIPPAVDRVIATCLALDPEARFHSAHDLALQLAWIANATADGAPAAGSTRSRRLPWGIAAASLTVAAGALVAARFGQSSPATGAGTAEKAVMFQVRPEGGTLFPVAPMFLTVAPDGSAFAFVTGEVGGEQRLYVRPLNSTEARALPGTENVDQPFWSADSRSIAFADRLQARLKRIDVAGGPPRTIADVPGGQTLQGGTWNQNGDILFAVTGGENPLFRVPAAGGTPVPATSVDRQAGEMAHIWPQFLPDGDHFLYAVPNVRSDRGMIALGSLTEKGATKIVDAMSNVAYSDPGFLLFVRDDTLLAQRFDLSRKSLLGEPVVVTDGMAPGAGNGRAAFAASRNGVLAYRPQAGGVYTTSLTWLDREGRSLGTIGQPNLYRAIALSPNGTRVAAQIGWTVGSDIWIADVNRGIFTRLTTDPSNDEWPVWSPDSSRIAFASNRNGGTFDLYEVPADGSAEPRLIFKSPRSKKPVQWSNDGRWLLFTENSAMFALQPGTDQPPLPLGSANRQAEFARLSPNGEWLAYAAQETDRLEIYVERFPTPSGRWPVSTNGGTRPHWRGDGRELYYLGADNQVYSVAMTTGQSPVIGRPTALFPVRLTSPPRGATTFDGIEPDANGRRFLVNLSAIVPANTDPVFVQVNWPAALMK